MELALKAKEHDGNDISEELLLPSKECQTKEEFVMLIHDTRYTGVPGSQVGIG